MGESVSISQTQASARTHAPTHTHKHTLTVCQTHQRACATLCAIHPTVRHVHCLGAPALPSSLPPHPKSIDWRFVRAVSPDDSVVAPPALRLVPLQEETGDGGEGWARDSGEWGLVGAGRTARASAGGIGRNRAPDASDQGAARIDKLLPPH
jgi:hypothetical protein